MRVGCSFRAQSSPVTAPRGSASKDETHAMDQCRVPRRTALLCAAATAVLLTVQPMAAQTPLSAVATAPAPAALPAPAAPVTAGGAPKCVVPLDQSEERRVG